MPTATDILLGFILPAILVGVAMVIGWWPKRDGRWIGAIEFSVAFALAACSIAGAPRWPPGTGDASSWLVWFTIPIGLLGFLDALLRPPTWFRALLLFILVRIGAGLLIAPTIQNSGTQALSTLWSMNVWIDCMAAAAVIFWVSLETLAGRVSGVTIPLLLFLTFGAAAAIFGLSDNAKQSEEAAALSGLALAVVILARPLRISADRGMVLAAFVPLVGMLTFVHVYSYTEPPPTSVALLLLAPLLGWCGELPAVKGMGAGKQWAIKLIPVLLLLAAAIGITARQFLQSSDAAAKQSSQQQDF
jgi:hypothetical protein